MKFSDADFTLVPEKLVLAFGHEFSVDLYIRLSETKIIKLSHKEDDIREAYLRYKLKGLKHAYVRADEYKEFIQLLKLKIANQQATPTLDVTQRLEELDAIYMALREVTLKLGMDETSVELAKDVASLTFKNISKVGNVYNLFKTFKNNCSTEYMSALMVTFVSCSMIEKFPWASLAIKEKLAMAALLCDVTLTASDFEELKNFRTDPLVNWENKLNARIYNHPLNAISMLGPFRTMISTETLTIIEQHHEDASGTGYPKKIHPNSINLLSAIFIVAEEFSYHLGFVDFDYRMRDDILAYMKKKFDKGNFKKAFDALSASFQDLLDKTG